MTESADLARIAAAHLARLEAGGLDCGERRSHLAGALAGRRAFDVAFPAGCGGFPGTPQAPQAV